jgi:phosphate:Na+ symporter
VRALLERNDTAQERVIQREELLDDLSGTITEYLLRLSAQKDLPPAVALRPALLLHVATDVERIGDHAENIAELARMRGAREARFSEGAVREIETLLELLQTLGREVEAVFAGGAKGPATAVLEAKRALNRAVDADLDNHAARLHAGICIPVSGILYVELVMNLRRVANHLRNIAMSLASGMPEQTAEVRRLKEQLREGEA